MKHSYNDLTQFNYFAAIEEKELFPGDTLELSATFIVSISEHCILTLEALAQAKRAFAKSLRKSLKVHLNVK